MSGDSYGEEIVIQALWNHDPKGNNDHGEYKLESDSLD